MSSGPKAVLVLMCSHVSSSCWSENGSDTGTEGRDRDAIVCCTLLSSSLLNAGSSGRVDMLWMWRARTFRLSFGASVGGSEGDVVNVGRGDEVDGTVRCHAVQTIL